jgi:hypothetical protein
VKIGYEGQDQQFGISLLNQIRGLFVEQEAIEVEAPLSLTPAGGAPPCDLVFVQEAAAQSWESIRERRGLAVLVSLVNEGGEVPLSYIRGDTDEVLSLPIRPVDVFALFRRLRSHSELKEFSDSQKKITSAVERLEQDVILAEQLQKAVLPARFTDIRGFKVRQRYLAGLRGGDWFDIAEARDGSALHFVLSDGSSSGLSSAVSASLTRVAMRVSLETARSPLPTVQALHDELQAVFTDKHKVSLIYGVLMRAELKFKYITLGRARILYQPAGEAFRFLESHGPVLQKGQGLPEGLAGHEMDLSPQDRLIYVSDGFLDGLGGESELIESLQTFRTSPLEDILNDWAWKIRKELSDEDLPAQECSALGIEVDSRVIRLARPTSS